MHPYILYILVDKEESNGKESQKIPEAGRKGPRETGGSKVSFLCTFCCSIPIRTALGTNHPLHLYLPIFGSTIVDSPMFCCSMPELPARTAMGINYPFHLYLPIFG